MIGIIFTILFVAVVLWGVFMFFGVDRLGKSESFNNKHSSNTGKGKKEQESVKELKEPFETVSLPGFGDVTLQGINNSTGDEPIIPKICVDGACLDLEDLQSIIMTVMSKGAEIVQRLNVLYDIAETNAERNRIIISEIDSMADSRKRQIAELKTRIDEMADAKRQEMDELREKLRKITEEKDENARRLKVRMRDTRDNLDARMRD